VTERPKSSHEPASAKEQVVFVIDDDAFNAQGAHQSFSIGGPGG
jgi:hypothetical protein